MSKIGFFNVRTPRSLQINHFFFARNLSYAFIFHKNVVITCRSLSEGMFLAKNRQKYRFSVEITLKNFHFDPKTCQNSFLDLIYP